MVRAGPISEAHAQSKFLCLFERLDVLGKVWVPYDRRVLEVRSNKSLVQSECSFRRTEMKLTIQETYESASFRADGGDMR